jgi:hypothetical protein
MILLTKGEELLLVQFHEAKGERVGAHVGDVLGRMPSTTCEPGRPGSNSKAPSTLSWATTCWARRGKAAMP